MPASYSTTTKWALRKLTGGNLVSDVDAGFDALATDLDPKLTPHDSGLESARPTSTPGTPGKTGRTYRSTDQAGVDLDTGTSWLRMAPLPLVVTTLPVSPTNLQEVYLVHTASTGDAWHLQYRAATGKWHYLGGPPKLESTAVVQGGITTIANDATLSLSAPYAGVYDFAWSVTGATNAAGGYFSASLNVSGATGVGRNGLSYLANYNTDAGSPAERRTVTALNLFCVLQFAGSGGTSTVADRVLAMTPVRLG